MRKQFLQCAAVLAALPSFFLLTGFIGGTAIPSSLNVPFIPQLGKNWCWAATTEMVTTYYHDSVDHNAPIVRQCDEVRRSFGTKCTLDCPPPTKIPKEWDQPNIPFTPSFGYDIQFYPEALSWDSLQGQIAARKPVIFQWYWSGITQATQANGGAHFLVAEGCPHSSYINTPGWVSIHDPLPVGKGRHRIIAYNEYANTTPISYPGYKKYVFSSHGTDMYGLTYGGGK